MHKQPRDKGESFNLQLVSLRTSRSPKKNLQQNELNNQLDYLNTKHKILFKERFNNINQNMPFKYKRNVIYEVFMIILVLVEVVFVLLWLRSGITRAARMNLGNRDME